MYYKPIWSRHNSNNMYSLHRALETWQRHAPAVKDIDSAVKMPISGRILPVSFTNYVTLGTLFIFCSSVSSNTNYG